MATASFNDRWVVVNVSLVIWRRYALLARYIFYGFTTLLACHLAVACFCILFFRGFAL
jgi:hypothetical protein